MSVSMLATTGSRSSSSISSSGHVTIFVLIVMKVITFSVCPCVLIEFCFPVFLMREKHCEVGPRASVSGERR